MPIYGHHLNFITPIASAAEQLECRNLRKISINLADGREMIVSLLGTDTRVLAIACTIPDISLSGSVPNFSMQELDWIERARDSMLSVVKLVRNSEASFWRPERKGPLAAYYADESPDAKYEVRIGETTPVRPIDLDSMDTTFRVFLHNALDHVLELLSEGNSPHLPDHYRYLALYKVIELEHPTKTRNFHESIQTDFQLRGMTNKASHKLLPILRTKIAHAIATGSNKPGLTAFEKIMVNELLAKMFDAIIVDLESRYKIKLQVA